MFNKSDKRKANIKKYLDEAKKTFFRIWNNPLLFSLISSFFLVLMVEGFSRHSVFGGFEFLFCHPLFFLVNMLPIFAAMTVTYLIPKRIFAQIIVVFILLLFSVINFVLLFTRITPLEAVDFSIIRTGISIIHVYLNVFEIILCAAAIVIALSLLVFACIKTPKSPVNLKKGAMISAVSTVICVVFITVLTVTGVIPGTFKDTIKAYDEYGFIYCFSRSFVDRGINKPDDYSKAAVDEVLDRIDLENDTKPEILPNIIVIQLESFMDPSAFKGVEFEKNPVPNFTYLKDEYTSGILYVPSVGSGTANTEFEVITGMNLDYFGLGEYPYKTILRDKSCETICFNLREFDYTSHAFHNHTGTFYDRNVIYEVLGFNTFTPLEYMNTYDKNPLGWAKDYVLEDEILNALDSTEGRDFVFAVSVQGHGKYPEKPVDKETLIDVKGVDDEKYAHQLEYYAYQLYEMDDFVGRLLNSLSQSDEKCVVVLYGDHQPSLEYEEDDITFNDKHASEYVIWANYDLEENDEDIEAYQLASYTFEQLGLNCGILTKYHQMLRDADDYEENLELLEYDMLYGEGYAYKGGNRFVNDSLQMGINTVSIKNISRANSAYYVKGEHFTESSVIFVNGREKNTVYISPTLLLLEDYKPQSGDSFTVKQKTNDNVILGSTKSFEFNGEFSEKTE